MQLKVSLANSRSALTILSNVDPDPPTLQTDGQTGRRTSCNRHNVDTHYYIQQEAKKWELQSVTEEKDLGVVISNLSLIHI